MLNYKHTIRACFTGYIVLAIVNNFLPLLFLTFQNTYHIALSKITLLITINFAVQLLTDIVSTRFIDKIGYRVSMVIAHAAATIGFVLLAILPDVMQNHFLGIVIADVVYAVGGGLLEVLVSPIVEACPTENKEKEMSLLHSFYCWGHVGVVAVSSLFFFLFSAEHWQFLALFWALIPLVNGIVLTKVPINHLIAVGEKGMTIKELSTAKIFWVLVILMILAGASEQAVSQWASVYAETGFHLSKGISDIIGPMFFAVMMGLSRVLYGKWGEKINLLKFMIGSTLLCLVSYLLTSLSSWPLFGLIGCGLCGFSVGILWPGTFSLAAAGLRKGGTVMFALLAFAGDVGCMVGPTYSGFVSDYYNGSIDKGILYSLVFPILMLVFLCFIHPLLKKNKELRK